MTRSDLRIILSFGVLFFAMCARSGLLAALLSLEPPVAPAYVNSNDATASDDEIQVALAGVVAGNSIVVGLESGAVGTTTLQVVDNAGGTYGQVCTRTFQTGAGAVEIYYLPYSAGGNITITATLSTSVGVNIAAGEFSNAGQFDACAVGTGTSENPVTANLTTTAADALLVGFISYPAANTFTVGTHTEREVTTGAAVKSTFQNRVVNAVGTFAGDGTLNASVAYAYNLAAFKNKTGGAGKLRGLVPLIWRLPVVIR
jgi:hypothetical protein